MDEFSQSVPVPICKRSIQRRLSNLWLSQENCCEKTDDFVENRKNRVRWCRNRLHWTLQEQWNKIIFQMKCCVNQERTHVCMCDENEKKGGTHYAQDCMDVVMAAPVCLMFWDVFVKTSLVQSQKQKEILTRLSAQTSLTIIFASRFKIRKLSGFSKMTAPQYTSPYRQNCRKITMMSIVLFGHPNHQTLI